MNGSKDSKNFSTPGEPTVLNLNLAEIVATPSCLFLPTDSLKLTNGLFAYVWSVLGTGMVPCTSPIISKFTSSFFSPVFCGVLSLKGHIHQIRTGEVVMQTFHVNA